MRGLPLCVPLDCTRRHAADLLRHDPPRGVVFVVDHHQARPVGGERENCFFHPAVWQETVEVFVQPWKQAVGKDGVTPTGEQYSPLHGYMQGKSHVEWSSQPQYKGQVAPQSIESGDRLAG